MAQQKSNTKELNGGRIIYNFMSWGYMAFTLSGILLITSTAIMAVRGFNWGLDFTGGLILELSLEKAADLDQIRNTLEYKGFKDPLVQNLDNSRDLMVRMAALESNRNQDLGNKVLNVIKQVTGQNIAIKRVEFIGPRVSQDLTQTGSIALLVALICIFIYISFRFEWRLATGTVLSLFHDLIITLGVLSLIHIEIDLTIIAALMSVIAYSLNDSIVISDRIRENFRKICHGSAYDIFNVSLTQTLHRTIITSATTLLVILILLIFGGKILHGFSTTLLIGVFFGTLSSIYVASTLALNLGTQRKHLLQQIVNKEGADQASQLF